MIFYFVLSMIATANHTGALECYVLKTILFDQNFKFVVFFQGFQVIGSFELSCEFELWIALLFSFRCRRFSILRFLIQTRFTVSVRFVAFNFSHFFTIAWNDPWPHHVHTASTTNSSHISCPLSLLASLALRVSKLQKTICLK